MYLLHLRLAAPAGKLKRGIDMRDKEQDDNNGNPWLRRSGRYIVAVYLVDPMKKTVEEQKSGPVTFGL